jgi:ribosome maturation factor RimP
LERKFDREVEDFELEVSSPGLDRPLKLPVQYEKNLGRQLDVVQFDGSKITGKLAGIHPAGIQLETQVIFKEARTGKRKKELKMLEINFEAIKTAKIVISLKK